MAPIFAVRVAKVCLDQAAGVALRRLVKRAADAPENQFVWTK
jgi:hypothetical protein